jgi:LmbE family N-acetylglucosaminyl deacetylase
MFSLRSATIGRGMKRALLVLTCGLLLAASLLSLSNGPGTALPPPSSGGLAAVDSALQKLSTNKRLLIIAAHPDDEDTPLLTLVSRGMGGEAAYLSLTRGDGGQNLIGDELGPALGLIRTEELNAARRLDGARQYFTRAYDFGFSKSLEETLRFWPKQALLEDTVRVIRRFRPQVIASIFSGTPRDGHGQHQAAGVVAREAFHLAGDPSAFPELAAEGLKPWQPKTLYQTTRFLDREKTTIALPTGVLEPLTGRSFQQIAVADRSLHRSQGTGALQQIGPSEARVGWLEGGAGRDAKDLFAGIDTTLSGLAEAIEDAASRADGQRRLARAQALARETRAKLSAAELSAAAVPIAAILEDLRAARALLRGESSASAAAAVLDEKIAAAQIGVAAAAGLVLDALADVELAAPGDTITANVQLWNPGSTAVQVESLALASPAGWQIPPTSETRMIEAGTLQEWKLTATVPADASPTLPYFLKKPLTGGLYDWSDAPPSVRGEPYGPPPLSAAVTVRVAGTRIVLAREVTYRIRDEVFGEIRHGVRVVPPLEVAVDPDLLVRPLDRKGSSSVSVDVASNARAPIAGRIEASLPAGWTPSSAPFSLAKKGDHVRVELKVEPPRQAKAGRFEVPVAAAPADGPRADLAVRVIDYEHIRPVPFPRSSRLVLTTLDLKLPTVRNIGYLRGASDRVPEALSSIGLPIHVLSASELERGDLRSYDAIVLGVRAYETEPALAAANGRLLDYVRNGGLLLVQYQQPGFTEKGFAPEKLEIARDRVTDEIAPVKILDPTHPIFTTPNQIGPADWEGWVQERGLYFAHSWAPVYAPLLSMADPGEAEQKGSLLVAQIGKGHYIYTGLAFFRELPAGVPGAYRLFANLLAWRATTTPSR